MAEEKGADTASLRHIVACVDGSEIAHKAFEVANTFFTRRDFVTVLHCAVPGKGARHAGPAPANCAEINVFRDVAAALAARVCCKSRTGR